MSLAKLTERVQSVKKKISEQVESMNKDLAEAEKALDSSSSPEPKKQLKECVPAKKGETVNLKENAPVGSFEYIRMVINDALKKTLIFDDAGAYDYYLMYVYPEKIICSVKDEYYEVPYEMDSDYKVSFGKPVEVEQYYAPKQLEEGAPEGNKNAAKDYVAKQYPVGKSVEIHSDKQGFSKGTNAVIKSIQVGNNSTKIGVEVKGKSGVHFFNPGEIRVKEAKTTTLSDELRESGIMVTKPAAQMDFDLGEFIHLNEATFDPESGEVEIVIIESGTNPIKKRHYPDSTIREAAPDFKGLKMYINHPTRQQEAERPERDLRDWVSTITESWYEDGKAKGKVKIHDSWLKERLKDPVARGQIGVSINTGGKVSYGKVNGEEMQIVEKILLSRQSGPASVDWVTEAGARGRVSKLLKESQGKEKTMELKEATFEDLNRENPTLVKSIKESVIKEIQDSEETKKKEAKLKEAEAEVEKLRKEKLQSEQKGKISAWLKESKLPEVTKQRIEKELGSKIFDNEKDLKESFDAKVKEETAYVAQFSTKGRINLGEGNSSSVASLDEKAGRLAKRLGLNKEVKKENNEE